MFEKKGSLRSALMLAALALALVAALAGCATATPAPTAAPPTAVPATSAPAATAVPAAISPANSSMKGKIVTLIVPHGPGGGYDSYARLAAPYIEKYTGASVTVKNVTAASGVAGRNDVWNAPKDGLTIGFSGLSGAILGQLSGMEGIQGDQSKYTFLARIATEPRGVFVNGKSAFNSIDDFKKAGRTIKFSSSGTGDDDFFITALLAQAFGWNMQQVTGYQNNSEASLALAQNTVDAREASISSNLALVKSGDLKPILIVWNEKVADYPNVPTAYDAAGSNADTKALIDSIQAILEVDRSFFGPQGMDAARTAEWRAVLMQVMKDPDFVADATKGKRPVLPLGGDELRVKMEFLATNSGKLIPILKSAVASVK